MFSLSLSLSLMSVCVCLGERKARERICIANLPAAEQPRGVHHKSKARFKTERFHFESRMKLPLQAASDAY